MAQLSLDIKTTHKVSEKMAKQLGSWTELYPFFESVIWEKLKQGLKPDLDKTTPYVDNWFKAFRTCPQNKLKVVWLGMSPYYSVDNYTNMPVADGLTFSTDTKHSVPPSLFKVYKAIEADLWNGLNLNMDRTNNLEFLAEQGVLLLNAALTTIFNDSQAHIKIWKPFTSYIIDHLNKNYEGLVFAGFGNVGNEFIEKVDKEKHLVFELEHPAYAAREHRNWKHEDLFSKTNEYLTSKNKEPILWDKSLVNMEVPF